MAGQICPIFERLSDDTITIIGAWMQHPINIQIIPDEYNFIEIQHISPILSSYLKNELCRSIPNDSTNVGRGCRFETGAFIMGCNHPAPNEKGGIYGRDFEYKMKDNQGVTILVREKISENPLTTNVQDNFHSNDSLSESNNHVTKSQNWFFAENQQKNVRQIITHDQNMEYQDSEFSNLALSGKYENLMSQKWVCGYFRTDDKPGPYLLVRADGHINYLKDCPIRIAFSFYRKPSAGLFGLFVAADTNDELKKVSPHGHAVFECIFGLDNADAVQRIKDALSKEEVRLCFADKSESLSQEVMDENGNFIEMSPPCCQFDRIFKIDDKCRQSLLKEFKALLEYHETTNCDFQTGMQELSADFPPSDYPILSKSSTKNSLSEKENTIPKQEIEPTSEEDELYQCGVCQTSWNKQDIGEYLVCPDCNGRLSYSQSENEIEYANINNKPTSSKKQFMSNSKTKSNMVNLLFSFNGRILRSDYWLRGALVLGMVTSLINISVLFVYLQTTDFMLDGIIQIGAAILLLWPISALWTKRLHDRGRTGKQLLFILIPIIGQIYFIWLVIQICFLPGDQKENQFGPVPVPEVFSPLSKFMRIGIIIVLTLANMLWPFLKIETISDPITPVVIPLFGTANNIEVISPKDTPEKMDSLRMTTKDLLKEKLESSRKAGKDMIEEELNRQLKDIDIENKVNVNPEHLDNLGDLFKTEQSE